MLKLMLIGLIYLFGGQAGALLWPDTGGRVKKDTERLAGRDMDGSVKKGTICPEAQGIVCPGGQGAACPGGQGVEGVVRVASGNRMPAPGMNRGALKGVRTTIYVFELTNVSQAGVRKGSSPYYSSIRTRLVTTAESDSTGHFCLCLPAGRYSLFTRKGEWYFAPRRDADNNLAPVEVAKGKMTQVECQMEGDRPPVY